MMGETTKRERERDPKSQNTQKELAKYTRAIVDEIKTKPEKNKKTETFTQ